MCPTTVAIWIAAPLQYLWITVNVVPFEKVSFSDTKNPTAVCYNIDSQWETLCAWYRQFTATNSDAIIPKTKTFSGFFFTFLKSILNFQHFPKKDDSHSWCISGNTGSEKDG